jgi:riboflavin kinase/FMN adenylyltransferase
MQIWTSPNQVPADFAPTAVTIGKFDGIHLGHKKLIAELCEVADNHMLAPVVITFDRHPDAVLNPEQVKLPIVGPEQKKQLLAELGVSSLLNLTFDRELADLTPEEFVKKIVVDALKAQVVLVGESFRFGNRGAGDVNTLRELGAEHGFVIKVVTHATADGQKVSSTLIREKLDAGDVAGAAKLLGRNHRTTGEIEHGLKIGRTIGFPTANMSRDAEGYLPLDGVYSGWLYADSRRYPAALSVGINETFQAVPRLVEGYVLDQTDLDLYGKIVDFEYVDFVRATEKFDGVESLIEAINRDIDVVRNQLGLCWPA